MLRKIFVIILAITFISGVALATKTIDLPQPKIFGKKSLEESIYLRRSEREFTKQEVSLEQLSQILWAGQGITDKSFGFRTAPSAGALYPITLYVLNKDGVFKYIPDGHKLVQIQSEDKRPSVGRASLGQAFVRNAPLSIVISGNFNVSQAKYGARAFRYVCMEIGHISQNIHLQVVALGLGSVPVGAFWDDVVRKNLDIPDTQAPLYIIPIGHIQK